MHSSCDDGEISSNDFGVYEDNCEVRREWIQYMGCAKWMHIGCLTTDNDELYVCQVYM